MYPGTGWTIEPLGPCTITGRHPAFTPTYRYMQHEILNVTHAMSTIAT